MTQTNDFKNKQYFQELDKACNLMIQDDATGQVYGIYRKEIDLKIEPIDIEKTEIWQFEKYEMVIFDGGNSHGDNWKYVFYPMVKVHSFIYETETY